MSRKAFELDTDDPIVERFRAGFESWERPFEVLPGKKAPRATIPERTRGAPIRRRGGGSAAPRKRRVQ
jgi:hypothetical protein